MLPLQPLRGHWRRPDLRNHRKLVVADGVIKPYVSHHNHQDERLCDRKPYVSHHNRQDEHVIQSVIESRTPS